MAFILELPFVSSVLHPQILRLSSWRARTTLFIFEIPKGQEGTEVAVCKPSWVKPLQQLGLLLPPYPYLDIRTHGMYFQTLLHTSWC